MKPLDAYQGMKHEILSRKDMDALCLRMAKARDAGRKAVYERLRNRVLEGHVRFAAMTVQTMHVDTPAEDRMQYAMLGMVRAAELFDPTMGFAFSTYAKAWILQAVSRAAAVEGTLLPVPAGEAITVDVRIARTRAKRRPLDLDHTYAGGTKTLGERLADDAAVQPDEAIETRERAAQAVALMGTLTPREHRVIRMRFGMGCEPMTLDEIGAVLGVCRERIRQIEKAALDKMACEAKP